ncbi:uncharacterized protein BDCG_00237 [Blastomyces dermatitidis ER-3]|uniref:Uncharacterized protein n=1 Tax=Ajellomyces dermatitidis (strain ER-3 / ATCC MYA-2586) TaxID=559297 RepID=A0ABP2EK02_AJEDR|nr:uncharacterized protein BDCG_00237 [Blastomyces dermatitidis ER-3]EEQ83432.2 hypothetical protein BDCG_00237 [Blastomyces dermatitidis ER-3]
MKEAVGNSHETRSEVGARGDMGRLVGLKFQPAWQADEIQKPYAMHFRRHDQDQLSSSLYQARAGEHPSDQSQEISRISRYME